MVMEELLRSMADKGASDLHIKAGSPPGLRIDGKIVPQEEYGTLQPEQTEAMCRELLSESQWMEFCSAVFQNLFFPGLPNLLDLLLDGREVLCMKCSVVPGDVAISCRCEPTRIGSITHPNIAERDVARFPPRTLRTPRISSRGSFYGFSRSGQSQLAAIRSVQVVDIHVPVNLLAKLCYILGK